jgi:hypothetical protein
MKYETHHERQRIQLSASGKPRTHQFYSPTEAFFDKSWQLPDFEKID